MKKKAAKKLLKRLERFDEIADKLENDMIAAGLGFQKLKTKQLHRVAAKLEYGDAL